MKGNRFIDNEGVEIIHCSEEICKEIGRTIYKEGKCYKTIKVKI